MGVLRVDLDGGPEGKVRDIYIGINFTIHCVTQFSTVSEIRASEQGCRVRSGRIVDLVKIGPKIVKFDIVLFFLNCFG